MNDELLHYGVKGMRWGRRKERYTSLREKKLQSYELKTKYGEKLLVKEERNPKFGDWISSFSEKQTAISMKSTSVSLYAGDKKVGCADFHPKSSKELYLNWLGVDQDQRGKGYASAAFEAAVKHGRENGYEKITLDVPGKSPDARHIYTKQGFVVTREATPSEMANDPMFGGLTTMALDLRSAKHSDMLDPDEFDDALLKTFTQMTQEEWGEIMNDELLHYGVKGMKWGRRKSEDSTGASRGRANQPIVSKPAKPKPPKSHKAAAKTMTNKELKKAIDRMTLEKNYARLADEMRGPIQKDAKSVVINALSKRGRDIGKQVAYQVERQLMNQAVNSLVRATMKMKK